MNTAFRPVLLACLLALAPCVHAQQASDAEIDRLLEVMRAEQQSQAVLPQMLAAQQQIVDRMSVAKGLGDEDRKRLNAIVDRQGTAIREAMTWDKLEPIYRDIYRKTFTDAEVQALVEFYGSPAGQGFLDKMPLLMQNTMSAMQALVVPIMQELERDLEKEAAGE